MPNLAFRERYTEFPWQQQIGNMASTLARVASRAVSPQYDKLVADLLREAALFIEWSAPYVPASMLLDLAQLQRELLTWQHIWPVEGARTLLALQARNTSDRLLSLAGLI